MDIQYTSGYVRDTSGALINNDVETIKAYKERRRVSLEHTKKIQRLEETVKDLERKLDVVIRTLENNG